MDTIPFNREKIIHTLPMKAYSAEVQSVKPGCSPGDTVGSWVLKALLRTTPSSELWYCIGSDGQKAVFKLCTQPTDPEVVSFLNKTECEELVPLLDTGIFGGKHYEVSPWYRNGCLEGSVTPGQLKEIILPSIIRALSELHSNGLVHNDIKPSNLYWNDECSAVLLGDFGNAARIKEHPRGVTFSYAAPEILLGDCGTRASDWASVGITMASLLMGNELIPASNRNAAIARWEKGIRYSGSDVGISQLINGMLQTDPRKRLGPNAAKKWCGDMSFGAEERTSVQGEKKENTISVSFIDPDMTAVDIESLLTCIEQHWDQAVFLFQQSGYDRFLSRFDRKWPELLRELRKQGNDEDGLFKLTFELMGYEGFIWRGIRCQQLLDLERSWSYSKKGEEDAAVFLQRGHASYVLEKKEAEQDRTKFVKELRNTCRQDSYEACSRFFQALRGDNGLRWGERNFSSLSDVTDWLYEESANLDEAVDRLFESKAFEAWFVYQGMENVMENIRRRCES